MSDKVWSSMVYASEKLLLDKACPNQTLVEEALSFDAALIETVSDAKLRQYLIVLGQYLITLQYEENKSEAICRAWQKALDSHIYQLLKKNSYSWSESRKATLTEKRAWVIDSDDHAKNLDAEFQVADVKRCMIQNMYKPVEQYINTLKKEVDARENDKRRS
jgi:hypothetical protein